MRFFTVIPLSVLLATGGTAADSMPWETAQYYKKTLTPIPSSVSLKNDSSGQPKAIIQLEFGGLMGSGVISLTGTAKPGMITGFPGPSSLAQSAYEPSISDGVSSHDRSLNIWPTSAKNSSYNYPPGTTGFYTSPTANLSTFQGDGQRLAPPGLLGLMAAIGIQLAAFFA
ncbi:hypothetical protein K432DRAFT_397347 [Lepidopterella palustris CBS 459.81]|uniref:Uncharacterized protein n=1 Tax=Lepidopterella palustris CBS 459.81 TaxID=1314670 RepID=A0A8E2JAI2_9PEZI|nr:hypothetical protein K432DRAFT_397347 [Lepidopterella palustris CBS 459.81]